MSCFLQSVTPLVVLGGLHLEVITDLAWSPDGRHLAVSSYDCYCRFACLNSQLLEVAYSSDCRWELATPFDSMRSPKRMLAFQSTLLQQHLKSLQVGLIRVHEVESFSV